MVPSTSSEVLTDETQSNRCCPGGSTPGGGMWFHRESKRTVHLEWCRCYPSLLCCITIGVLKSFSKDTGNKVNYQAVGSGAGVRQFKAKTVDFGASDGAVSDAKQPAEGMVHIPMTGGAIVPAYNYPGCEAKMTQTELADVFLGKID